MNIREMNFMKLTKMTQDEFNIIKGRMITDYAKDKVKVGHWQDEDAIHLAKETLDNILRDGVDTKGHYLIDVCKGIDRIGFLWFNVFKGTAYVNNYLIYDEFKGESYEVEMVEKLEEMLEELSVKQINLHSFGYNEGSIAMYLKMGYDITDVYMSKKLGVQ